MKAIFLLGLFWFHFFDSHAMQKAIIDPRKMSISMSNGIEARIVISAPFESHGHGDSISLPFIIHEKERLITVRLDNISTQCTIQCIQKAVQSITHRGSSFRFQNKKKYAKDTLVTQFLYGNDSYEALGFRLTKIQKALTQK